MHQDQIGNLALVTNNGVQIDAQGFYAYGRLRSGGIGVERSFTGQQKDFGTGLIYFKARYYDPELGIFISPDTIVPDAGNLFDYNRYMYVRGNPLKYNDPSGHCATLDGGAPDLEGDGGCWDAANEWFATFGQRGYDNADDWHKYFASSPSITEDILRTTLHSYWAPQYQAMGVYHQRYNPSPQMHPAPEYAPVNIPNPCNFWDCPAILMGTTSLGVSIAQTGAAACTATGVGAPLCGPAATYLTYVDIGLNTASIVYEGNKFIQGNSTTMDLSVTLADSAVKPVAEAFGAGASATPGIGVAYDAVMLGYDIFIDPFVRTPGQPRIAK